MATGTAVAQSVAEKFGEKALQYINALEEVTKQYAPDVVNAALKVVQLEALGHFLRIGVLLVIIVALFITMKKSLPAARKQWGGDCYDFPGWCFLCAISCIGGIVGSVALAVRLTDVWLWTAMLEPKLFIAYKIFGKLL